MFLALWTYVMFNFCAELLRLRGRSRCPPPTKIFLISCSFWENLANVYVAPPRSGWFGAPCYRESWIRPCKMKHKLKRVKDFIKCRVRNQFKVNTYARHFIGFFKTLFIWVTNVRERQPTRNWWSRNVRKLKPRDTGLHPALSYCAHHYIMRTWSVLCHNPITERPSRVSYLSVSDLAEDRVHFYWRASCDFPCIYQAIRGLTLPWSEGLLHHRLPVPGLTPQPSTGLTSTGERENRKGTSYTASWPCPNPRLTAQVTAYYMSRLNCDLCYWKLEIHCFQYEG